jgi:hypothetical protein
MNHYPIAVATALLASVSTIANAAPAMTLYPQQIGAETARYQHGSATISLKSPTATVEIRPCRWKTDAPPFPLPSSTMTAAPPIWGWKISPLS